MNPWPIAPITEKDLDFATVNYDFTGFTASALADGPAMETFLDATLADGAASVADQAVLIASMDDDIGGLGGILGEIGVDDFETGMADLPNVTTAGDSLLTDFTNLIGPEQPPPAGNAACDEGPINIGALANNTLPCRFTANYVNKTGKAQTLTQIALVQDPTRPAFNAGAQGGTIKPGASMAYQVTVLKVPNGDYTGTLQLYFDTGKSPWNICFKVSVGDFGSGTVTCHVAGGVPA